MNDPLHNPFLLERYKYILNQKRALNEKTFKIVAIYQAAVVLIGGAQFEVIKALGAGGIRYKLAMQTSVALFSIAALVSVIAELLLIGGVLSWMKYRADEAEIERKVFERERATPTVRHALGWYETYIVLGILLAVLAYALVLDRVIIPDIAQFTVLKAH